MNEAASVILSMTGFGRGCARSGDAAFTAEVRSVNNRHLKLTFRAPDPYPALEAEVEKVVRQFIRRGGVLVHLSCDRPPRADDFRLNTAAARSYIDQVREIAASAGVGPEPLLTGLLALPNLALDPANRPPAEDDWPAVEQALTAALTDHRRMRSAEGEAMARELLGYRDEIAGHLAVVRELAPRAVAGHGQRLRDRVQALVAEFGVTVKPDDLIREVAVYAERTDVAEEIVRLDSHLQQFAEVVGGGDESAGRKLEFITQEMGREVNTLGSKAGDVTISRRVVEIKAALEKVRELILNVE